MGSRCRDKRVPWHEFFMQQAFSIAERSTCNRRKIGAVAVKEKRIIACGFNGAPRGAPHCLGKKCYREEHNIPSGERSELCWAVHAEVNLLAQVARFGGPSLKDADVYCTHQPCISCLKDLINAGIRTVYYVYSYPVPSFYGEVLSSTNIKLVRLEPPTLVVNNND